MTFQCNECNEALDAAKRALEAARRLVLVADNALANGDPRRARSALRDLYAATASAAANYGGVPGSQNHGRSAP